MPPTGMICPTGGAQNTFLGWYRNLEDMTREIAEIQAAPDAGAASYTLQYSV